MTTVRITKTQFSYAIVEINNPPVNALTTELWTDLTAALAQCEQDSAIRGIVICSGLEKDIFSAGNDLLELYAPKLLKNDSHNSGHYKPLFWPDYIDRRLLPLLVFVVTLRQVHVPLLSAVTTE